MGDWNEQGAPNLNLSSETIRSSEGISKRKHEEHHFSEELADGGDRDNTIKKQLKRRQPGMG